MLAFRTLLVVIFTTIAVYTMPVIANHGLGLFTVFFGDIAKMDWPGQFNLDFLGFLVLSAFWTAWRNNYSPGGIGLSVMAFFFGAPFLTMYLMYLSFGTKGDVPTMILGESRAVS